MRRGLGDRDQGLRSYFEEGAWGIHGCVCGVTDWGVPEKIRVFRTLKAIGGPVGSGSHGPPLGRARSTPGSPRSGRPREPVIHLLRGGAAAAAFTCRQYSRCGAPLRRRPAPRLRLPGEWLQIRSHFPPPPPSQAPDPRRNPLSQAEPLPG